MSSVVNYYIDATSNAKTNSKQELNNRLAIFEAIRNGRVHIANCDLSELVDVKLIPKSDSASYSIMILGKLKYELSDTSNISEKKKSKDYYNDNIVIKLSVETRDMIDPDDPDVPSLRDNSLKIEREVYKKTNEMLRRKITPHFMAYITSFECDIRDILGTSGNNKEVFKERFQSLLKTAYERGREMVGTNSNVLILERGIGETLQNISSNFDDWETLIFQIAYTLHAMHINGIQHNDLHSGNVWVQPIEPTLITYYIGSKSYTFDTNFIIKIYDYDLGFIDNTGKSDGVKYDDKYCGPRILCSNTKLEDNFYYEIGLYNKLNPKFDFFTILKYLETANMPYAENPEPLGKLIYSIVSKKLLDGEFGFFGRLCKSVMSKRLQRNEKTGENEMVDYVKCIGTYDPTDEEMLSPIAAIEKLYKPDSDSVQKATKKFTFKMDRL
jgi:hypothetical protein